MRRPATLVAFVGVLMFLLVSSALATEWGSYRDEFRSVTYSGSDGTLDWSSQPWVELNDDGDKTAGVLHVHEGGDCVAPNCLHMYADALTLDGVGVQRPADTSVFSSFELCYEVRFDEGDLETTATLYVEKSVNGGQDWHLLATHELYPGLSEHPIISIGGPYESTIIRFTVDGFLDGEVFIDDVELKGALAGEPTTTITTPASSTTTKPTTTTTVAATTTTKSPTTTIPEEETTTTTSATTDTTQAIAAPGPGGPFGGDGPPAGSGIRETDKGLQVVFDGDLFGEVPRVPTVFASVDHRVDFRIAAEVILSSWIWMVLLGCSIAWALVSGLDRRRALPAT